MLSVGLTGGIGSGKSEVSQRFARVGVPVIDTDLISRDLVAPGSTALGEIGAALGSEFITEKGGLDRRRLRQAVFDDLSLRRRLEDILHPRIRDKAAEALSNLHTPYAIVVVPLLIESRYPIAVDRVLVVDTPQSLQVTRVTERDGISVENTRRILDQQATREARRAAADDIIVNDGDLSALDSQVGKLHERYLALSALKD